MKKLNILIVTLCIGFLMTNVNAIVEYFDCIARGGTPVPVTYQANGTDIQECHLLGYKDALFHCCSYSDCNVIDPCPPGGAEPGKSCCNTNPDSDYNGYACCIPYEESTTTTTTIEETTTTTIGEEPTTTIEETTTTTIGEEPTTTIEETTTTIPETTTTVRTRGGRNRGRGGETYGGRKATCYDGLKNCHDGSCEIDVDCGGPCKPCPSCFDGVQNQGESGVDCGGPCKPCPTTTIIGVTSTIASVPNITTSLETTIEETTTIKGYETSSTTTTPGTGMTGQLVGLMPAGMLISLLLLFLILLLLVRRKRKR